MFAVQSENTPIYLNPINEDSKSGKVYMLVKLPGLLAIYDESEKSFGHVDESVEKLNERLESRNLKIEVIPEEQYRICSEETCGKVMQEGYYFESDGTTYCSEACLTKVVSMKEYMEIYNDDGAYYTNWDEC